MSALAHEEADRLLPRIFIAGPAIQDSPINWRPSGRAAKERFMRAIAQLLVGAVLVLVPLGPVPSRFRRSTSGHRFRSWRRAAVRAGIAGQAERATDGAMARARHGVTPARDGGGPAPAPDGGGSYNGCPPGYWRGPWGHCRDTPYHGPLPNGGWQWVARSTRTGRTGHLWPPVHPPRSREPGTSGAGGRSPAVVASGDCASHRPS